MFMKKEQQKKKTPYWVSLCLLLLIAFTCGCKDDLVSQSGYDPSKPVVFTDFSPDEGNLLTPFYIRGENFGTDPSKVHITIGGQNANAIGCNGHEIYCMVPRRAFDGIVKVSIESTDGKSFFEYEFEKRFNYVSKTSVGTLCGGRDEYGTSADVDGTFKEARFSDPQWLLLDTFGTERCLYVSIPGKSIRKIDLDNQAVSTLITNGQGSFSSMQFTSFDITGDTIFISDDNGRDEQDRMGIGYLLRSESFRKAQPYVYDGRNYSCTYHPITKSVYYSSFLKATLKKVITDPEKGKIPQEECQTYPDNEHAYLIMHPTGRYMYILGVNCVYKSTYNPTMKKFETPIIYAGQYRANSYADGSVTTARFDGPKQGTFVKNEEYVKAGKSDVYDFYLCDSYNHCIRKITPDGFVSTYAGRGSISSDNNPSGSNDGDLRKEARFNLPSGIVYDEETHTFYICEMWNMAIRTISVE